MLMRVYRQSEITVHLSGDFFCCYTYNVIKYIIHTQTVRFIVQVRGYTKIKQRNEQKKHKNHSKVPLFVLAKQKLTNICVDIWKIYAIIITVKNKRS